MVVRKLGQNLTMDGLLSHDPSTGDNIGMSFNWNYGTVKRQSPHSLLLLRLGGFKSLNISEYQKLGQASGRVINIDSNIVHDNETLIVNLTVAKGNRVSSVLQAVLLGDPCNISQR